MRVLPFTLTPSEQLLCDRVHGYVDSPSYQAMINSRLSVPVEPSYHLGFTTEREFYLALHYFPRRFTAIYEELRTLLCAVYVRSQSLLHRTFSLPCDNPSLGLLAHLTIPLVQRALGSQVRATVMADLNSLRQYQPYYTRALQLHSVVSVSIPSMVISDAVSIPSMVVSDAVSVTTTIPSMVVPVKKPLIQSIVSDTVSIPSIVIFDAVSVTIHSNLSSDGINHDHIT